jgi:hypothetical protein
VPDSIINLLPSADPSDSKSRGGPDTHRNPNCGCRACVSRRRRAQAIVSTIGAGGATSSENPDALNADLVVREDGTIRARIVKWLQLKQEDSSITIEAASRKIGCDHRTLNSSILRAVEEGWLKFEDPISNIEYQIIPKVVRNLSKLLDAGDKQVTLETAKGTIFKTYQESMGISEAPKTVLALKIEYPEMGNQTTVPTITGQILGTPRILKPQQKEIINGEQLSADQPRP